MTNLDKLTDLLEECIVMLTLSKDVSNLRIRKFNTSKHRPNLCIVGSLRDKHGPSHVNINFIDTDLVMVNFNDDNDELVVDGGFEELDKLIRSKFSVLSNSIDLNY